MLRMRGHLAIALAMVLGGTLAACKGSSSGASDAGEDSGGTAVTITQAGAVGDGGEEAGAGGLQVAAIVSPAPVFNTTEFPPKDPEKAQEERKGAMRLGYLRKGGKVSVKPQMIKKANCPEGWFELTSGGFVCGKFATLDLASKELETAPHDPFADQALPYEYGMNLTNGTPLYRRIPKRTERQEREKGLAIGKGGKPDPDAARTETGEVPWYAQEHHGEKVQVSFDELREGGLVIMRMVRGFYLSLDIPVHAFSGKFWRTTDGFFVPADHVLVHKASTEFQGVDMGDPNEKRHLPLGFATGLHARKFFIDGDKLDDPKSEKKLRRGDHIDRFTVVQLTGKRVIVEDKSFYETDEGWYLRGADSSHTNPGEAPKDLKPGEKWIDVNLSTQTLVAFEGDKPVYATLISSGRHNDEDKSKDHRTVQGVFAIREKHVSATMDDDGAGDGTYSIQDVPWIMYFKGSYALHGAFWHAQFGHEKSHGCVNLEPVDARHIFEWVGPKLPPGWHGVRATDDNPGTRVVVHD